MEAKQMTLFSVDEALAVMDAVMDSPESEDAAPFVQACKMAKAYGRTAAYQHHNVAVVRDRVFGYVDGLSAVYEFGAVQRETLTNLALTHADIVLQARQN